MDILQEIRSSGKKGKELNEFVAKLFQTKLPSNNDFSEALAKGSNSEKGACVEGLEYLSQKRPDLVKPFLAKVIECLGDKAPRVKWEAARVLANVANTFPKDVEPSISALIKNAADSGTVVRWSAAFALGVIAKACPSLRPGLVAQMTSLSQKEKNSGVKDGYLKALKEVGRL